MEHAFNVLTMCNAMLLIRLQIAYYWCTRVMTDDRTLNDEELARQIAAVLINLESYGIEVCATSTDNEAVNNAAYNLLSKDYPHLIAASCCAHTLQLIVKDLFSLPWIQGRRARPSFSHCDSLRLFAHQVLCIQIWCRRLECLRGHD